VYISYILQLALLLVSSVLPGLLSFRPIRTAVKKALILISVILKNGRENLSLNQTEVEALLVRKRAVLVSFLVEFQEAQCFFMLASAVECLKALYAGPSYFNATNNIQAFNNATIFVLICTTSTLPLGFILSLLYTEGMASWYITVASITTIVLSSITASRTSTWRNKSYSRAHYLNIYWQILEFAPFKFKITDSALIHIRMARSALNIY
jgi:hypothetical protein